MHYRTKLGFIFAGLISCQTFAATFSIPEYFEFMYVDQEEPTLINDRNQIEINAGKHELVVRYNQTIEEFKEEEDYHSEPIIVDLEVGQSQQLKMSSRVPDNTREAEAYSQNPEFKIVDQGGKVVAYQSQLLPLKAGFQWGRDYLQEINDFKEAQTFDADKAELASLKEQLANSAHTSQPNSVVTTELESLKALYNKADWNMRRAYRFWIIDPSYIAKQETEALKTLKQSYLKLSPAGKREMQIWMIE